MGAQENKIKSQRMAADLVARGFFHGKRKSSPRPNSGGLTFVWAPGSSKYQRLVEARTVANSKTQRPE